MTGAASHEAHDLPLADRLVQEAIRGWLNRATDTALAAAGSGALSDYERGKRQGIEQLRWGHLDNYWYTVLLQILDELRRSGLLTDPEGTNDDQPA